MVEPPPEYGLYFLTFPDAPVAARISHLARRCCYEFGIHGAPRPTPILHVSLVGLGRYDELEVPKFIAVEAGDAVEQVRATPFTVMFNYVQSFAIGDGRHALVLRGGEGTIGLEELYRSLDASLRTIGFKARRDFTPHMTLLYTDHRISERRIDPISWTVRDFSLVLSLRGKTKYIVLDCWPLGT